MFTPTAYKAQAVGQLLPAAPFNWAQKTLAGVLDKVDYLGHTENFKTVSKNYRAKKRTWNAMEKRRQFEGVFVERELAKADAERKLSVEKAKVDIVTLKRRDEDLDMLFKRSYEDMVAGRLTAERFDKLCADYEAEQQAVKQTITEMEKLIESGQQEQTDLKRFLQNVRKYTDPETLTAELLNDLVDRIIVYAPDKSSGHRRQKIEICYKAVGVISFADELCVASHGALGQKKPRKTA